MQLLHVPYLKIQDWAHQDRPREKLIEKGSGVLTDAELLGILIGSGIKRMSAVDLAQLILKHHDNDLNKLARQSVKELQQFKGIGQAKAVAIVSAMELARRRSAISITKPRITDAQRAYELMLPLLTDKHTEEFWIILLNKANYVITQRRVSAGGVSSTIVDPKIVFKMALEHNASQIILVHNHPSGHAKPSQGDVGLTQRLVKAASLLDIIVADHIIFTDKQYFSFVDAGLL